MPNWKKKTRHQRKMEYQKWLNATSWRGNGPGPYLARKSYNFHQKQSLRRMNRGLKEFESSPFYEDCRYHPCKVTQLYPNVPCEGRLDVDGESLIDGSPSSCSYEHCGILHLSESEANERLEFMNSMGMIPYQMKFVYHVVPHSDPSLIKEFILGYSELEKAWGFTSRSPSIKDITEEGKAWLKTNYDLDYDRIDLETA